jgi:hypothetical protein
MKQSFIIVIAFLALAWIRIAQAESEDQMAARYADALQDAAKYALTEMRPTASFRDASLERIRSSDQSEGGDIKARVSTSWVTAFTGKNRRTVIDIWISVRSDGLYLTRYKLYSDDHNIPIANPQDARVQVKMSSTSSGSTRRRDDF